MPDRTTTTGRALAAAALVATLAIATTACASDDTAGTAGESTTTVAPPPGEWSTFGYDLANTRTNPDEVLVSPSTASTLDVAWEVDGLEGVASTPAVGDGTVDIGDWTGAAARLLRSTAVGTVQTVLVAGTTTMPVPLPGAASGSLLLKQTLAVYTPGA